MAGMKEWSRGGGEGGKERTGVEEGLVCRLKCGFEEILSQKCKANSCGRAARGDDVDRERFAVLCRMLLMVFQRAEDLDEEDWISAA